MESEVTRGLPAVDPLQSLECVRCRLTWTNRRASFCVLLRFPRFYWIPLILARSNRLLEDYLGFYRGFRGFC